MHEGIAWHAEMQYLIKYCDPWENPVEARVGSVVDCTRFPLETMHIRGKLGSRITSMQGMQGLSLWWQQFPVTNEFSALRLWINVSNTLSMWGFCVDWGAGSCDHQRLSSQMKQKLGERSEIWSSVHDTATHITIGHSLEKCFLVTQRYTDDTGQASNKEFPTFTHSILT